MKRYYIPNSSVFDSIDYNKELIKETLKSFTLFISNIREAYPYGLTNQRKIITFSLSAPDIIPLIEKRLNEVFDTKWIMVKEKDF